MSVNSNFKNKIKETQIRIKEISRIKIQGKIEQKTINEHAELTVILQQHNVL